MKADDYVVQYRKYLREPRKVWSDQTDATDAIASPSDATLNAIVGVCLDMLAEAQQLAKARKAQTDSAIVAVLREMNQKFMAFARRLPDEPIPPGFFKLVLARKWPAMKKEVSTWPGSLASIPRC